jgi:hypothetical protein
VVHPRHREFYEALFPFHWFPGTRPYRRINYGSAMGLRTDLRLVRALIRIERAGFSAGPLSAFLCGRQPVTDITAALRRDLPRSSLTPLEWAALFGSPSIHAELATFLVGTPLDVVHPEPGGDR